MTIVVSPQWVEVVDVDPAADGWVAFIDPQGRAEMTFETARRLHARANGSDTGSASHKGRRFDRDVLAAVVRAIDALPTCTVVAGRRECGQPGTEVRNRPIIVVRCSQHEGI